MSRFTFEYDMTHNVPGKVGTTEIRFDLVDGFVEGRVDDIFSA